MELGFFSSFWPAFLASFLVLFSVTYLYLTWNYGTLEKLGIPVLPPILCFGSVPGIYKRIQQLDDLEYVQKLGKLWSLYDGRLPNVFVAEPEMLKQILLKDFDHFLGPRLIKLGNKEFQDSLTNIKGEKWKALRTALSPVFTTNKLKGLTSLMKNCVDDYLENIKGEATHGKSYNVTNMYQNLVMEIIACCIFGTKVSTRNGDNELVRRMIKLLISGSFRSPILLLFSMFPFLVSMMNVFDVENSIFFSKVLQDIMEQRRHDKKQYGDFVDFLNEAYTRVDEPEFKRMKITEETLRDQAMVFLVAGFASTSMTLSATTYYLAKNPEFQTRAAAEVEKVLKEHGEISYDTITHLEYLSACLQETMRLCPSLVRLERLCNKDWQSSDGKLTIPNGTVVKVPVYAIHHDPDNFPDPEKYDPERFMPGQPQIPYTYMPFGGGPRNCIAMRFALEEMKIVMAGMLKTFKFSIASDSELKIMPGLLFTAIEPIRLEDIKLKVHLR